MRSTKPLTPGEQRDIDDFLYLAEDSLHQAATTDSVDELSAILSKGDNNLLEMLKRVRGLDPANAKALQLTHDAAGLYASKARTQLAANKPADAFRLVVEGQNFEHNRELFRLKQSICERDAAVCAGN